MDETLKILVEYVLEKCTGLEMEHKRLTQQLQKAEELKDRYYDGYLEQAKQLANIAKLIKPHIEWRDGKPYALHLYDNEGLLELVNILKIERRNTI